LETVFITKLKKILQSNYFLLLIIIFSIILCFLKICIIKYHSNINPNKNYFEGVIDSYSLKNNNYKIIIKNKEKIICYYYSKTKIKLKLGESIKVKGLFEIPSNNTIPNNFNYRKYLNNHHIYYIFKAQKLIIKNTKINIIYQIKNYINEKCNKFHNRNYFKAFILGNKEELDEYKKFQINGVSHLFAISGMHISLLTSIILFILKKFPLKNIITIIFLIAFSLITNYSASILRSVVFFILLFLNKKYNLKITTKNILIYTCLLLIINNPLIIYDMGFLYSSIVTFGLILSKKYYKKNYFYNLFITSFFAYLFSIPITSYFNYELNIMAILNNLIIVPLISIIIYPLCLICFICPFIEPLFNLFIIILEFINNNLIILNIIIPKVNLFLYFIYYVFLLIFIFTNKIRYLSLGILYLFSFKIKPLFNNNLSVYYIDVKQGDSTLISTANQKVLIDTGGLNNYQIGNNIIKLIKSLGSNHIDYLILTHGDYDHMGEAKNIVENFKVENVIFNCGAYNNLENELLKILDKKKINYYSCIKELNIDKYKLQFLNTGIYDNENDNSNVIYFNYNYYKFLFMGDAGIQREKSILEKYNLKNIDFLKVGHHGSNTSSSKYFINRIQPKYSLISVGKNNRYGHPQKSVLNILNDSKVYRTDKTGSIEIKLNKNGYKVRSCPP
jgi:competence protein ComEC